MTTQTPADSRCDLYTVLRLQRGADAEAIRHAYKLEAMHWHPGKNPADRTAAEAMFKQVAQAYEVLSNPVLREKYDRKAELPHDFLDRVDPFQLFQQAFSGLIDGENFFLDPLFEPMLFCRQGLEPLDSSKRMSTTTGPGLSLSILPAIPDRDEGVGFEDLAARSQRIADDVFLRASRRNSSSQVSDHSTPDKANSSTISPPKHDSTKLCVPSISAPGRLCSPRAHNPRQPSPSRSVSQKGSPPSVTPPRSGLSSPRKVPSKP